jgi:hypothetical protein
VLGPPWTDADAERGHGGVLTGAWPPDAPVRQSSRRGRKTKRGVRELGSGLTGAWVELWRPGDGGAEQGGGDARWEVAVDSEAND